MNVDYITEINGLDDWEFMNPLPATAYKMMRKLQYLAYLSGFPERIRIANTRLCSLVGCTENSLIAARQQLIQRELIDYKGGKKQLPVYSIRYFSLNPAYNLNKCGYAGGINGGINRGINGGINRGINGGRDIDEEDTRTEEEEIYNNISIPPGEHTEDHVSLYHPFTTEPYGGVDARAREGGKVNYPPRTRRLNAKELRELAALRFVISQPPYQKLFGKSVSIIEEMIQSDRFPLDLIGEALSRTRRRDSRYLEPLGSPIAYMQTLLEDWESEGFKSLEELKEARGDYSDA